MVKLALLGVLLPVVAAAEPPPPPETGSNDAHNKLGFRIDFGRMHALDRRLATTGLALELEHPVLEHTRVFAEYEWMWFGDRDAMTPATEGQPGIGHRASLGLRAEVLGATVKNAVHFYLDAELGGGLGVMSDDISGVQVMPHAFIGLRTGYDFLWGRDNPHSSRSFEAAFTARALRMPDGATAGMLGVSMAWGD